MKTRKSRVSFRATTTMMPKFSFKLATATMLFLSILTQSMIISAERDFNVNDSQVPLLEPKDAPQQKYTHYGRDPYSAELARCDINDDEILLSLVLKNQDWHALTVTKLEAIQNKLAKFFALPKMFIFMESITKYDINEMQKTAIRKGNLKVNTQKKTLGRVSIMLGCDDRYFSMASPIINQIGQQMKDGSINEMTGENFGWWIIWRKQQKNRSDRLRRQAESSGDDYEYEDDYDYGEDEEENAETVTEIPQNPTVTTHAHRHHHGASKDENEVNSNTLMPPEDNRLNGSATTPQSNDINSPSPAILSTPGTVQSSSSVSPDTTTPTIINEYVETKTENNPPLIRNRLQKLAVTSGKPFHITVPEETFIDNEDLTNLRLELTDKDGHELKSTSWIQFNADTREIYGLPLDDAVSKWSYRLSATDSGNETVTETFEISVQQHRGVRSVNHEISIVVKLNEKNNNNIDWQLKLINGIAKTLGDESISSIVVRDIRQTPQDPNSAIFVYFNETLPTSECPESELNELVRQLDASRLSDLVHPILSIKSISGQLIGQCQKQHITKPKPTSHMIKNQAPVPRNQVDRVNATVGHLLVFKVPTDTFYDPNDDELTLSLKTKEHKEISPRHWLQFDSKNQEFYGIPKSGDIGSEEYLLVGEDAGGLSANDALVVIVNHAPKRDFSAYFKAYLGIRHEQFNADLQRKFVERVSQMFGDTAAGNNFIQIRSITTHHDSDSTIVNFYNTTLQRLHNRCPEHEIEIIRNQYLVDGYILRDRAKKALGPELNLTNVGVILTGSCNQQTDITHREFIPTKTEEPSLKSAFGENYMTTYVVPAIIIISVVLAAAIIACCLHRCRNRGKMELGDEEERKSFRTKGIPVIFQDELDEKPEIGNKSPIILKDEKPPLLPPSYNTSNMHGDNDVDEYVPPPAVIVGGREARGKSPATPSYRKPPPYVSP